MLVILKPERHRTMKPLQEVCVKTDRPGTLSVTDGRGREYFRSKIQGSLTFYVGGALGLHTLRILDQDGGELERLLFKVDCETEIEDAGGRFKELLAMLHNTMNSFGGPKSRLFKGKVYNYFVWWIRDHVHTLKGMKYFDGNLKSAIELFRDSQREDGMIWDLVEPRTPAREESDERFEYDNFVWPVESGRLHFKRIPVENDVEYLYVEGIYYTWKATGDDGWMEGMLNSAIKAFDYTQTSPYRWSKKYNLLKRAFTIDTWDFQSAEDAKIAGDDIMAVYTDRTRFGIMHGDNTGFAASCKYLSEIGVCWQNRRGSEVQKAL